MSASAGARRRDREAQSSTATSAAASSPASSTSSGPELSQADESAVWQIRAGFRSYQELVQYIADLLEFDDSIPPTASDEELGLSFTQRARRIVRPYWERQLQIQQAWPETTDADRLEQAFSSLERDHKIIARMNFSCCRRCGVNELDFDLRKDDTAGYVFFHEQTMDGMLHDAALDKETTLYLYFGSFTEIYERNLDIGRKVAGSLRDSGLSVKWSEDPDQAIEVDPILWRNRLDELSESDDESDEDDEDDEDEDEDDEENEDNNKDEKHE